MASTRIERNVLDIGATKATLGRRGAGGSVGGRTAVSGQSVLQQGSALDLTQAPGGALPIPMRQVAKRSAGMLSDGRERRFSDVNPTADTRNVRARLELGGSSQSQLNAISQWMPGALGTLPRVGDPVSFQNKVRGEQGIPMFNFPGNQQLGVTGITPNAKMAGTGNVAFAGFPGKPTRYNAMQGGTQMLAANSAGAMFAQTTQSAQGYNPFRSMD